MPQTLYHAEQKNATKNRKKRRISTERGADGAFFTRKGSARIINLKK
jgi:hypothetical protein